MAFVHDCFRWGPGERPAPYQDEIIGEIPRRKRVSARGPHGLGKTTMEAWVTLWFAFTREGEDWKAPATAGTWRQLTKFLWPEIRKWAGRLRWELLGRGPLARGREMLELSLKLRTGEAFALASDNPQLIEGAHADRLLYLFDESKAIRAETWDAAEGAFSTAGEGTRGQAYAFACSTPGEPSGRFYDIHRRRAGFEDWWVRHVTLDEAIAAGRISRTWADQRRRQWGEGSALYQNRVLGEFAASSEDSVIPLAWVELANQRWLDWQDETGGHVPAAGPYKGLGCDVGSEGDATVIAPRYGWTVPELRRLPKGDTMGTAGAIVGIMDAHGGPAAPPSVVDGIGIGAGVVDRVREQGYRVDSFVASHRSERKDKTGELGFANRRAEAWWGLRELLDPDGGEPLALPPDDLLIGDLTAPRHRVLSGGRILIEAKAEVKARLGRSTDDGDAVVQVFAPPRKDPPRKSRPATGGSRPMSAGYRPR